MSLYNMVMGERPYAAPLLYRLGFRQRDEIPRYRDCFFNGGHIVVLTRTGGGNREQYAAENEKLRQHPQYVSDSDDTFDSTFAWFRFKYPDEYYDELREKAEEFGDFNPMDVFQGLMSKEGDKASEAAKEVMAVAQMSPADQEAYFQSLPPDGTSTLLVEDLLTKPEDATRNRLIADAKAFKFDDFKSTLPDACPKVHLVGVLREAGYDDLAQNVIDGKYD